MYQVWSYTQPMNHFLKEFETKEEAICYLIKRGVKESEADIELDYKNLYLSYNEGDTIVSFYSIISTFGLLFDLIEGTESCRSVISDMVIEAGSDLLSQLILFSACEKEITSDETDNELQWENP